MTNAAPAISEELYPSDARLRVLLTRYDLKDPADYTDALLAIQQLLRLRQVESLPSPTWNIGDDPHNAQVAEIFGTREFVPKPHYDALASRLTKAEPSAGVEAERDRLRSALEMAREWIESTHWNDIQSKRDIDEIRVALGLEPHDSAGTGKETQR